MSITNRPLPPRKIYRTGTFPYNWAAYLYFADDFSHSDLIDETFHGMVKTFAREADVWHPVLNIIGQSGYCSFLALGISNNTGQNKQVGCRIKIDGSYAYVEERILIDSGGYGGFCLIGHILFNIGQVYPGGIMKGHVPFDNSLVVEFFTDNINQMDIVCARRLHWTF